MDNFIINDKRIMIEWLKEYLIGIALMAICWMLFVLYIGFQKLCDEDSKRGKIARKLGNISWGIFITYMIT